MMKLVTGTIGYMKANPRIANWVGSLPECGLVKVSAAEMIQTGHPKTGNSPSRLMVVR